MKDRRANQHARCAICAEGDGVHETDEGRRICPRCLQTSSAEDVKRLRRERRTR